MADEQDRRELRRFHIQLPAEVKFTNGGVHEFTTETRNVSARGVFFYVDQKPARGTKVEFVLTFPPELTFTRSIRVRFTGTVLRVEEPHVEGRVGIAAAIEHYEFLPESVSATGSS
jgi:PilZ domain